MIPSAGIPWIGGLVLALAALMVAEWRRSRLGLWLWKPLASSAFLLLAGSMGAFDSAYGITVFVALVVCWLGDLLLIPKASSSFLLGLVAFLAGHLAFLVAFAGRGLDPVAAGLATLGLLFPAVAIGRWLWPHLPRRMKGPVVAYISVISIMAAAALATEVHRPNGLIVAGAVSFFLSDLFVARGRFVREGFSNRAAGLPLYYLAQVLLALSIHWEASAT
jgi:uncharacterized membrane protein YhhN